MARRWLGSVRNMNGLAVAVVALALASASLPAATAQPRARSRPPSSPPTVARSIAIPAASLASGGVSGLTVERDGVLRASLPARTGDRAICAPIWFTAAALAWHQRSGGQIHARMSTSAAPGGPYGRATALASEPSEAPDPGSPEYHPHRLSTELLWTGGSRCLRFGLSLPAGASMSNLRAVFLNTSGSAAGPGTGPVDRAATASVASDASGPQGGPSRPPMVSRHAWGADPRYFNTGTPGCAAPYYTDGIRMMYVHHTSGTNDYTRSQSDDIVRAIYYFHTQIRGYCDIAYNFLIDRFGTIFVGRAGGVDRPVQPGSQMGFNPYTSSVSTMGNWQDVAPPVVTVKSLEQLLAWRLDVSHLPPLGSAQMVSEGGSTTKYPAGTAVTLPVISGHRDTGITDCPGSLLYAQLPHIRDVVENMGRPKFFRPASSATQVTPGGNPVALTATATDPVTWRLDVTAADGSVWDTLYAAGPSLDVSWHGTDASGQPLPPGAYTVVITAMGPGGAQDRPAELPIAVNPPVSPSPSPSPS